MTGASVETVSFPLSRTVLSLPSSVPFLLFSEISFPLDSRDPWAFFGAFSAIQVAARVAQSRAGTRQCGWNAGGVGGAQ